MSVEYDAITTRQKGKTRASGYGGRQIEAAGWRELSRRFVFAGWLSHRGLIKLA